MTDMSRQKNPYPLGAHIDSKGVRFSFVSEDSDCGILLYDPKSGKQTGKIPFSEEDRIGNIYCRTVEGLSLQEVCYQFYKGQKTVTDEHARRLVETVGYGKEAPAEGRKALCLCQEYNWEGDSCPRIPYSEAVFYCMHVRGFTKHASSGVKDKGTFAGIIEKIPYLKEIGITTLELQPAYEFEELSGAEEEEKAGAYGIPCEERLNYWGYKKGFYYTPKAAYGTGDDVTQEFKNLVKHLHKNGMELVMQFYFPSEVKRNEISEILRFWVLEYHVDGFHLMGEKLPIDMLAEDALLADCKLLYYEFGDGNSTQARIGEYNDNYLYDMRRFLKGDDNILSTALRQMRHIPQNAGRIHYFTNYYGFTLADLVTYDHKHNEANGEENRDGNDHNCSWNCGEEGATRSRKIKLLRTKQMKNAMCLLLLSQSTPLIFMGDEFGNSQKGNNNPWCQDNATGWLDWNLQKKNGELLEFWKLLTAFRREHPILHPDRELRLMDYASCGYPDLSYHGENAWRPQTESNHRHIGLMFCGKYATLGEEKEDSFLYVAINMHWEAHELALPKLPKGLQWKEVFRTGETVKGTEGIGEDSRIRIAPRSITVLMGAATEEKTREKNRKVSVDK